MEKMGSCINDSQWKIGAFLTNSYANPKKFRSRKKKIYFGLNQQPDCVVILNPDRKSSVILEADRSQIPIASFVDSTIPWESYKKITYPIPANDPIPLVYLFRHSIKKTVILERKKITAMKQDRRFTLSKGMGVGKKTYSKSSDSPKGGKTYLYLFMVFSSFFILFLFLGPTASPEALAELLSTFLSWLGFLLSELWSTLAPKLSFQIKSVMDFLDRRFRGALGLGMGPEKSQPSSEGFPNPGGATISHMEPDPEFWDSLSPIGEIPPVLSPEGGDHPHQVPQEPAAPPAPQPVEPAAPPAPHPVEPAAPPAPHPVEPAAPPAPPQPNLPVIPEEVRVRLGRRIRRLAKQAGVAVDAPFINGSVHQVLDDYLELDPENRYDMEALLTSLRANESEVDDLIRVFLEERGNR